MRLLILLLSLAGSCLGQATRADAVKNEYTGPAFPSLLFKPTREQNYESPQHGPPVRHFINENDGQGNYHFEYETVNGISAQEKGFVKNRGAENEGIAVEGFYQYYDPDKKLTKVSYTADENGFNPSADHLPTSPPIPEAIQKSLATIFAGIAKQVRKARQNQH